jgi:hypothetical protein
MAIEAAADTNMHTPEGLRYKAAFEKPYKEVVRQCVQPGGSDSGKFKALTSVGATGTVEDIRIYWNSARRIAFTKNCAPSSSRRQRCFRLRRWLRTG